MSVLPPDEARRLKGVLARLLSDFDGERLAAVEALLKLLSKNGVAVVDLVPREGSRNAGIATCWNPKAARRAMYPERAGPPAHAPLTRPHQRLARGLLWSATEWTDRESDFLASVMERSTITDRQDAWLDDLKVKAERQRARRESADA